MEETCEGSTEPSVAVTGIVPAATGAGPAIMPMERGEGASIQIARSPALCGAIATLPLKSRPDSLAIRSRTVTASASRFSTGMKSLLTAAQSHAPRAGRNSTAGCASLAKTMCSRSPSRPSIAACDVSTMRLPLGEAPPAAELASAVAITAPRHHAQAPMARAPARFPTLRGAATPGRPRRGRNRRQAA